MTGTVLTESALRYLTALPREAAVDSQYVAHALEEEELGDATVWLDFHERYAGYVMTFGRDSARLGIMFERATWLSPMRLSLLRRRNTDEVRAVRCADAHPSYEYTMDRDGGFHGMPSETFEVFLEQNALIWHFTHEQPWRTVPIATTSTDAFHDTVLSRPSLALAEAASDRFHRVRVDERYLLFESTESGECVDAWERRVD